MCFLCLPQRTASSVGIDRVALDELTAKHEELITQRVSGHSLVVAASPLS